MFDGTPFLYTDFSDQFIRPLSAQDRDVNIWAPIRDAAVASGAFPFAFRAKQVTRNLKGKFDPTLEPLPGNPETYDFPYTDGGVLQNQPLGMAKNLIDENDRHQGDDCRFYLFVSPSPMEGQQNLSLRADNTTLLDMGRRLLETYRGQAVYRDWIAAEEINQQVALLDARASQLAHLLKSTALDAAAFTTVGEQILALLCASDDPSQCQQDLARLANQYAYEVAALGGLTAASAHALLVGVLTLEKAGNLGNRERMRIYGIVTRVSKLAGAGISAFVGFFNQAFRDHDYDWGRTVARQLLKNPRFAAASELGPIRYQPSDIRPIDTQLNGLHLKDIPKSDIHTLKTGAERRANQLVSETISNPFTREAARIALEVTIKSGVDWEFSRDTQGVSRSKVGCGEVLS